MDSYRLKEEQAILIKEVNDLKTKKDLMEKRINDLHAEEIRYLDEIPTFRKQFEEHKNILSVASSKTVIARKELTDVNDELRKVRSLIIEEKKSLENINNEHINAIEEIRKEKIILSKLNYDIKNRESKVQERERTCDSIELSHIDKNEELFKRQVKLNREIDDMNINKKELDKDIESHIKSKIVLDETVNRLTQAKKFHEEDKQVLKDKLEKADRLVKENSEIKAQLLLQAEKLNKEIELCKSKQSSLDKNIADLVNQENTLKVKDLKIRKMAHDAGIQKELKELEESIK